jgi:hypothetical protein
MKAEEIVDIYINKLYDSEKYPDLLDFKHKLIKLIYKRIQYEKEINKNLEEIEIAKNSINEVGEVFHNILKYDFKPITLLELKKSLT